ncbi:SusC/RagA family TonB-linked outer membrane protein [Chryseosolibacter indicus]|uniref:TonB-dependent receptor n=1 Tax=Chryseosolibacter indicus TaxID=2782351 RepID=A0ABS5VM41_9BACT|nr:TonB-dependent receptor [Chryseosolibacter indicus]MBT1701900.1 TonB-dependent receptor [Chryseosolibacter indicus]
MKLSILECLRHKQWRPYTLKPAVLILAGSFAASQAHASSVLFYTNTNSSFASSLFQQSEINISGTVTSGGETMPGVNVLEKGTANGTTTDGDGKFTLNVTNPDAVLVFSFIGYTPQEIPVGNQTKIEVVMAEDISTLGEVVVVGYGVQKKVSLTNSVATVQTEALTVRPLSNLSQALQGQAAGLTVQDQGGIPGRAKTALTIRGTTSLPDKNNKRKNDPLVIVDGIEQDMNFINPNDIESVSILKDAASTAIYGSRAANGVILITTKRAKEGKVTVDYNGYYALQRSINNPEMMDTEAYMRLQQTAYNNAGLAVPAMFTDESIQTWVNSKDREQYPLPNVWYKELFKTAPQYNNSIAVSGGSENFKARMSARNMRQDALIEGYDFDLKDVRLNSDFAISKRISVSGDLNYRRERSTTPTLESTIYDRLFHGSLFAVPKYSDGSYGLSSQGHNPLMYAELGGKSTQVVENIIGSLRASWEIVDGLKFSTQIAPRIVLTRKKDFTNSFSNTDKVKNITKVPANNSLAESRINATEYTINNLLTYQKEFGKHNISTLIGHSEISNTTDSLWAYRERFYSNDVQSIGQGANDGTRNNRGRDTKWGLRSYMLRVNYAFADKYLFEVNGRYDGSSRFIGDNVYSFFPSVSAGWRISEEQFLENVNFIEELKIRGSWGKTGNQAVGLYSYYQAYDPGAYYFGGASVISYGFKQLANRDITWETTEQTNVGFDALLFENLSLSFDYYKKRTDGILINLPIPSTVGLLPAPQNAGIVDNSGIELALGYRGEFKPGFTYGFSGNFAMNKNEVVDLAGTGPYITGNDIDPRYVIKEGLPINAHWGYQTDGLFQNDTEIAQYPTIGDYGDKKTAKPGDVKYVDRNNDKIINADDMMMIGTSFPKFTYGFTVNLGYKNFELAAFFQGAADMDVRLSGALAEMGNNEGFVPSVVEGNYWTPTNPNAKFPRPVKRELKNVNTSDRMILDASYLKLKNIQLTYNLPSSLIEKARMTKASVYASATNVLTFSKLKEWGLDPEVESGRALYYPQVSLMTLGVNVQF